MARIFCATLLLIAALATPSSARDYGDHLRQLREQQDYIESQIQQRADEERRRSAVEVDRRVTDAQRPHRGVPHRIAVDRAADEKTLTPSYSMCVLL